VRQRSIERAEIEIERCRCIAEPKERHGRRWAEALRQGATTVQPKLDSDNAATPDRKGCGEALAKVLSSAVSVLPMQ
jgi:hypothetical protein